jgi:mannose-6-phosphate isomerase-like protein (cupin superfamily)
MTGNMATIVRSTDARVFMEGPELCREFVKKPKMWLGTSTLPAGARGNIDAGHPGSVEVFYVCAGHVLLYDEACYYELFAGDAIFIPEALPHTLINIGQDTAVLVWAGAPGE